MRKHVWMGILGSMLAVTAYGRDDATTGEDASAKVLEVESMIGVPRPYTGATNAIRGIPGGGLPWVISKGEAKLLADGHVTVEVEGLVFNPDDAAVIARGFAGLNNVPAFRAIVSCQTVQIDGAGNPQAAIVNVQTDPFPATQGLASEGGGDARIDQTIALPSPCIAPIVFVTSPTGAWFATAGTP
jgi:hypothetical protein